MIFVEPDVDYFRVRLHQLALPHDLCYPSSSQKLCSIDFPAAAAESETGAPDTFGKKEGTNAKFLSLDEKAEVLHRVLLGALHQRFPYESPDTLENVYILVVTHIASSPLSGASLSCEELSALRVPDSFIPPEYRCRTFPSYFNVLPSSSASVSNNVTEGAKLKEGVTMKTENPVADRRYNDTYFILIPELSHKQLQLYRQKHRDVNGMWNFRAALSGLSTSDMNVEETATGDDLVPLFNEGVVTVGEGMVGFHVLDGSMIHSMTATNTPSGDSAPRSLYFSVFKVPLSRFTPEEQQYYTCKREEVRSGGDNPVPQSRHTPLATPLEKHMSETMQKMLASEMRDRYRVDNESSMVRFFSKCSAILRSYAEPTSRADDDGQDEKATSLEKPRAVATSEVCEPLRWTGGASSAFGVRRLVYSFAPCDCYHLVTDENNPIYYAKSSRAAYDPRTVSITLVSDLTAEPCFSPTISLSCAPNTVDQPRAKGEAGVTAGSVLDGLVSSNQVSRAVSPEPLTSERKSTAREDRRSSSPEPLYSSRGNNPSSARASFGQLRSKTNGFLRLTTSLACNNVSGNPKHSKQNLLEKGLFRKSIQPPDGNSLSGSVRNSTAHLPSSGDVVNIFRFLSISSAAQHQLRHGVIRPVVSVAVLRKKKNPDYSTIDDNEPETPICHGLLDHSWYSIPVQSLPMMQDDVQWMPIVFGSTNYVSDVGSRTAMQIGFFPKTHKHTKRKSSSSFSCGTCGVLPTVEEAKRSLATTQKQSSALTPQNPNVLDKKQNDPQKQGVPGSYSAPCKYGAGNDEQPAGVTARRGGVAMTFGTGNDEQPAGVTARRGGVAMTFGAGNDEQPAGVTARRGGVAMTFGSDSFVGEGPIEREEAIGRGTMVGNEAGWRGLSSGQSPKVWRPTVSEDIRFMPRAGEGGGPTTAHDGFRSKTCTMSSGRFDDCESRSMKHDPRATTTAGWRSSSLGPVLGECSGTRAAEYGNSGVGGNCRLGTRGSAVAREDSPVPGYDGAPRLRPTTVLDPFGNLSGHRSSLPTTSPLQPPTFGRETQFYPPHTDRWDSNDTVSNPHRGRFVEQVPGNFAWPPSFGGQRSCGASDPLASPLSSMSRSGLLHHEEMNQHQRGGVGRQPPGAFHRFSGPSYSGLPRNASSTGHGATNVKNTSSNPSHIGSGRNWRSTTSNRWNNGIMERMETLYSNGAYRMPIIDEYDNPSNGSRVRPRGAQAMDLPWSCWRKHPPQGAGPPPRPVSSRVESSAMPWRHTTTTGIGTLRRQFPSVKPPLVPTGRSRFSPTATTTKGITVRSATRGGLSLRERIRLRQQQHVREVNANAFGSHLRENYCMGNDKKRCRLEPDRVPFKDSGIIGDVQKQPSGATIPKDEGVAAPEEGGIKITATNTTANYTEKITAGVTAMTTEALQAYEAQLDRLQSLSASFFEADGINVSFSLRDLANAIIRMPNSVPKEYDLTKAIWLDDGVSYFVSTRPRRLQGGWDTYMQHLNLYQQPFYLRERTLIFVLRVPYHPQLRVCVAVHNLDDFIALLQQRPLKPILLTEEEKRMRDFARTAGEESCDSPTHEGTSKKKFMHRFLQRFGVIKRKCLHEEEIRNSAQQGGWTPITWRQHGALLRLQAEATLRGCAWRACTTPLLTDPTMLLARMSFLSNRTATYAALHHRLNTLQALAAGLAKEKIVEDGLTDVRMIQDCLLTKNSLQLGCESPPHQSKAAFPPFQESKTSTAVRRSNPRKPFRVDRVGGGSATASRRIRQDPFFRQNSGSSSMGAVAAGMEVMMENRTKSTIAPYASSTSLSRPLSPTPQVHLPLSSFSPAAKATTPPTDDCSALLRVAESIASRPRFAQEVLYSPMITVLRLVALWEQQGGQQQQTFNAYTAQSSFSCDGAVNSMFSGPIPTPIEVHRQQECFDISVSQIQQLLHWQWDHHQQSYEAFPLPIFRGALVAPTGVYFGSSDETIRAENGLGISPLTRSLLLALTQWGWFVPIDYRTTRNNSQFFFEVWNPASWPFFIRVFAQCSISCFRFLAFVLWQEQVLWILLLYVVYCCFRSAFSSFVGGRTRWPAPLGSATSIVYRHSEASVDAMLEKRQQFRSQLLVTRILQVQHYVQNMASRVDMLLCGHSPILSLIIGSEILAFGLLFACYKFGLHLFPVNSVMPDVITEFFLPLLKPLDFALEHSVLRWFSFSVFQPSSVEWRTLGFLLILYALWSLGPWSPLRWLWRTTWRILLHDDALVRRPILSF